MAHRVKYAVVIFTITALLAFSFGGMKFENALLFGMVWSVGFLAESYRR